MVKEHDEVEDEADELHQMVEDFEAKNKVLTEKLERLEKTSSDVTGLQIENRQLLKEERDREAEKVL